MFSKIIVTAKLLELLTEFRRSYFYKNQSFIYRIYASLVASLFSFISVKYLDINFIFHIGILLLIGLGVYAVSSLIADDTSSTINKEFNDNLDYAHQLTERVALLFNTSKMPLLLFLHFEAQNKNAVIYVNNTETVNVFCATNKNIKLPNSDTLVLALKHFLDSGEKMMCTSVDSESVRVINIDDRKVLSDISKLVKDNNTLTTLQQRNALSEMELLLKQNNEISSLFKDVDMTKLSKVDKELINDLLAEYTENDKEKKREVLEQLADIANVLKEYQDQEYIDSNAKVSYFKRKYSTELKIKG